MKRMLLVVLTALLLSGCMGLEERILRAESSNWKAEYVLNIQNQRDMQMSGYIAWIGEGEPPEIIYYKLQHGLTSTSEGDGYVYENRVNLGNSSCQNCAIPDKNQNAVLTIMWDGQEEELVLEKE